MAFKKMTKIRFCKTMCKIYEQCPFVGQPMEMCIDRIMPEVGALHIPTGHKRKK